MDDELGCGSSFVFCRSDSAWAAGRPPLAARSSRTCGRRSRGHNSCFRPIRDDACYSGGIRVVDATRSTPPSGLCVVPWRARRVGVQAHLRYLRVNLQPKRKL